MTIGRDLFPFPGHVRNDGKAETDEKRRRMRERTNLLETGGDRAIRDRLDNLAAEATASRLWMDHKGPDFGDTAAERRQVGTCDDSTRARGHDEAMGMQRYFVRLTRQQMAFGKVGDDEVVDSGRVAFLGAAKNEPVAIVRGAGQHGRSGHPCPPSRCFGETSPVPAA
jgi:hypothetical protein